MTTENLCYAAAGMLKQISTNGVRELPNSIIKLLHLTALNICEDCDREISRRNALEIDRRSRENREAEEDYRLAYFNNPTKMVEVD
jgi:hypothetical protein